MTALGLSSPRGSMKPGSQSSIPGVIALHKTHLNFANHSRRGPRNLLAWQPLIRGKEGDMNQIIYLVGLVVIVIAILAFFGIG